ncbi:mCG1048844, partial [Mus musculus]
TEGSEVRKAEVRHFGRRNGGGRPGETIWSNPPPTSTNRRGNEGLERRSSLAKDLSPSHHPIATGLGSVST